MLCKQVGKESGFKLEGRCYSQNLAFKCPGAKHSQPISYNKRVSQVLNCAECKREQKEAHKQKLRQEEEQQSRYISQMQEEMFRKAREEMERELLNQREQRHGAYQSYQRSGAYSSSPAHAFEAERLAAIE